MSCNFPARSYILPPARIIAGIDASTITSLGTCRFSSSLDQNHHCYARAIVKADSISASMAALSAAGRVAILASKSRANFQINAELYERGIVPGKDRLEELTTRVAEDDRV